MFALLLWSNCCTFKLSRSSSPSYPTLTVVHSGAHTVLKSLCTEHEEDISVLVSIGQTAAFYPVFEILDDLDGSREVFTGEYTFNTLTGGGSPHSMMSFSQLAQAMFKQSR